MNEKKTVLEVLKETIDVLNNLRIPMNEMETIGFPVANSISNIRACVDAMERTEAEVKMKAEQEDSTMEVLKEEE